VKAEPDDRLPLTAGTPVTNDKGSGLHILVVDHDLETAAAMTTRLRRCGHRVQAAADGHSACRVALSQPPDVVLLELALPDLDGWEVARRLQETSWEKKPFLVAFTDDGGDEERRRSHQAGIDLHLVKPVNLDLLRRVLQRFHRVIMPTDAWPAEQRKDEAQGQETIPAFLGEGGDERGE
jgi:CheY-like chemotaxis protein